MCIVQEEHLPSVCGTGTKLSWEQRQLMLSSQ